MKKISLSMLALLVLAAAYFASSSLARPQVHAASSIPAKVSVDCYAEKQCPRGTGTYRVHVTLYGRGTRLAKRVVRICWVGHCSNVRMGRAVKDIHGKPSVYSWDSFRNSFLAKGTPTWIDVYSGRARIVHSKTRVSVSCWPAC